MDFQKIDTVPVWEKPIRQGDIAKPINAPGAILWSGDMDPPAIGEVIRIRINNIGLAKVDGYCLANNYLGVMATPLNPPPWYVEQNGGCVSSCVFCREIALVEKGN